MNPPTYPLPATMTENANILTTPSVTPSRHQVVALAYDGLCTFEFGVAVEIFGLPRPEMGDNWYQFAVAAVDEGPLRATGGIRLIAPQLIELLGLPANTFPIFGLCIGTPDIEMALKPRLPESSVYAENHYPAEQTLIEDLAQYEQTMSAFGEAREKLPYREKFARYYSNTYAPKNIPLLQQQGWLIKFE
mgnify:CR=1 FL=1